MQYTVKVSSVSWKKRKEENIELLYYIQAVKGDFLPISYISVSWVRIPLGTPQRIIYNFGKESMVRSYTL